MKKVFSLMMAGVTFMISFLALSTTGHTKSPPQVQNEAEGERLLQSDWQKIARKYPSNTADSRAIAWSYRVTPPLPLQWPPDGGRKVVYYAFPEGLVLGGGDLLKVGKPWATVTIGAGSEPEVRILRSSIEGISSLGVRPLSAEEAAVAKASTGGPKLLRKLASLPAVGSREAAIIRNFYCGWLQGNSVIASQLRPNHAGFFAWLDCQSWRAVPAR